MDQQPAYNNVIDMAAARKRLRTTSLRPSGTRARAGRGGSARDQRLHLRRQREDRLFVQVVLASDEVDLVGTTLSCSAVNMSVGGIQFEATAPLPVGSLLDLWIDIRSRPGKFFLAGEVRWVTSTTDGVWRIGVELKDGAATDIIEWIDYHADYEAK